MSMETTAEYEYLLTGRNTRGRTATRIVRAQTADQAVRAFESQGFSGIVLHTDDVAAPFSNPSAVAEFLSPRDQVAMRTMGEVRRYAFLVWKWYVAFWYLALLAAAVIGVRLFSGMSLCGLEYVALAGVLFAPIQQLYLVWFGPGANALPLLRAIGHARWETALRLISRVNLSPPPGELPMLKARALAGMGRLSEALTELDLWTGDSTVPRHVYWLAQSIVYLDARELDKGLSAVAQAHELAPDMSLITISYATRLLAVRRDVDRARALLADARRHAIADSTFPHLLNAEGVVALEDGRPDVAVDLLTEALRRHAPFVRYTPSILISGARMRANLCLALAAVGDTTAARDQLRRAAPLLAAHRESDLLKRCEEAVAGVGSLK